MSTLLKIQKTEKVILSEPAEFHFEKFLSSSLQGDVYLGVMNSNDEEKVVIKTTQKKLFLENKSLKGHKILENIIKESKILKMLSDNKRNILSLSQSSQSLSSASFSFVRYVGFTEDETNYYLVEEYGGINLHNFVRDSFQKPNLKTYQSNVQYIMQQLVNTVYYFHNYCSLCHLDLSLENVVINPKTMIVKICDFGLSSIFDQSFEQENNKCVDTQNGENDSSDSNIKNNSNLSNDDSDNDKNNENNDESTNNDSNEDPKSKTSFLCKRYCGKTFYKSPELTNTTPFDARLADVWALGVMLFMMLCCAPPFEKASKRDKRFCYIIEGKLDELLNHWKMSDCVPEDAKDLLNLIFRYEKERIFIDDVVNHKYVENDFKC